MSYNRHNLKDGTVLVYRPDLTKGFDSLTWKDIDYNKYDIEFIVDGNRTINDVIVSYWLVDHENKFKTIVSVHNIEKYYILKEDYIRHQTVEKLNKLLEDGQL